VQVGDIDDAAEIAALADAPVIPIRIAKDSAYGDRRVCPPDAAGCVSTEFHPGVDLLGKSGQQVFAPHDGWILYAGKVKLASKRWPSLFEGYGPNVILFAHDDVRSSAWRRFAAATTPGWWPFGHVTATDQAAVYSLLGHLGSVMFPRDMDSRLEQVIDSRADIHTDSWRSSTYNRGHTGHIMTFQPGRGRALAFANPSDQTARYVTKGTPLGNIGSARHVHWEIRTSPFGTLASPTGHPLEGNQRLDPMLWLHDYKGVLLGPEVEENAAPIPDDGGWMWLLALWGLYEVTR
jgi:hypothetical protein